MLTIEIDTSSEEIFMYATPEDLREFAKKLWAISEKADAKGAHVEEFTTQAGADVELCTALQGQADKHQIIDKLTISSAR